MRTSSLGWGLRSLFLSSGVATLLAAPNALAKPPIRFAPVPGQTASLLPPVAPTAGDTATQCGVITYCGGPVISNVQIVPVFWTSGVSSTITSWAPGYLKTIADSQLLDMLSEYSTKGKTGEACAMTVDGGITYAGPPTPFSTGQTITRGTATQAYTITPTVTTGTSITDDNAAIGQELVAQIAAGHLPAPTYDKQGYPNTIYFVFFPQNVSITLQGGGSCSMFGGYHYSVQYSAPASCKSQYLPYAVLPDCGGGTPDSATSHELAEAVTDTDVGPTPSAAPNAGDLGWYLGPTNPCNIDNSCPSNCGEVGDVCQSAGDATIPGTSITSQNIWSQVQNNCGVNNPSISTQSGPTTVATSCGAPIADAGSGGTDAGSTDSGSGGNGDSGTTGQSDSGTGGGGADASLGGGGQDSGSQGGGGADASLGGGGGNGDGGGATGGNGDGGNGANGGGSGGGSSGGCGCSTTPAPMSSGFAAVTVLFGLALTRRRRKAR